MSQQPMPPETEHATSSVQIQTTPSYTETDKKFDIVTVHGLYGPSENSWAGGKDGSSCLTQLAVDNGWECRVIQYAWKAKDMKDASFTRSGITREAGKLLDQLVELRKESPLLPLAFFAHDLGGIIIKEVLILAGQYSNQNFIQYAEIKRCTRLLMFFGCPHRWSSVDQLETNIARFLWVDSHYDHTIRDVRNLSQSIIAINGDFLQTGVLNRANIINASSTLKNIQDRVFDSSIVTFQIPFETWANINKPHKNIDRAPDNSRFYSIAKTAMKRVAEFPWYDDEIARLVDVVESLASPVYPQETIFRLNWLSDSPLFKQWHNDPGPSILHIHGSSRISQAAEYVFREARCRRNTSEFIPIFYFKFDKHDIRRNSIGAMANTFLSQIFSQVRKSPADMIGDFVLPGFTEYWTDQDAFYCLEMVIINMGHRSGVQWIIDGIDECDDPSRLLSAISGLVTRSEQYFKVVVTSVDSEVVRKALSGFPDINVRQCTSGTKNAASKQLKQVLLDRPVLNCATETLQHLLEDCGDDEQLRHLFLNWLRISHLQQWKRRSIREDILSLSPLSAKSLVEHILETLPVERQSWGRRITLWILFAVHPLTPAQLAIAVGMELDETTEPSCSEPQSMDIWQEINECFGSLFVMKNGQIEPAHPAVREVCLSRHSDQQGDCPWYVLHQEKGHIIVTSLCLRYLSRPSVQEQILAICRATPITASMLEAPNFICYAIKFWPLHYHSAFSLDASKGTRLFRSFFSKTKTLQCWAAASWYFSNHHIRSNICFLSPLPIFASLGLDDLVIDMIKLQSPEPYIIAMSLTEASRFGHRSLVQSVLHETILDPSSYLDAMVAAARSDQFLILGDLLDYITEKKISIHLPETLIARAAFSGRDNLLKLLLQAGAKCKPEFQYDCPPALHAAVMRNNISTAKILLNDADPVIGNQRWDHCPAIVMASRMGHGPMVRCLLEAGASTESHGISLHNSIWWALVLCHHHVLDILVTFAADGRCVDGKLDKEAEHPWSILTVCHRILMSYGKDPNDPAFNPKPSKCLENAAFAGHPKMCRLFLDYGADPNGSENSRPLLFAIESGKLELVNLLLEKGADVNAAEQQTTGSSISPLSYAARHNDQEMATFLMEKGANINLSTECGWTPLCEALFHGHVEMARLLLDAGADISKGPYKDKMQAIHTAHRHAKCMELVLDFGGDENAVSNVGTPLCQAASSNFPETARLLVSRGAQLESIIPGHDLEGFTALHVAAHIGEIEILHTLLEAGANVDARTRLGETPLMLAVEKNSQEAVKALLEYNPNVQAIDEDGNTVLHFINDLTPLAIAKCLVNRGAKLEVRGFKNYTPLGVAVFHGNVPIVEYLIQKKAKINIVGSFHGGPMHIAAIAGNLDLLKLLRQNGGDVNLVDPRLGNALYASLLVFEDMKGDRDRVARYLLDEAGVDVHQHDRFHCSPLSLALLHRSLEVAKSVLHKAVDIDHADNLGWQPIHCASFKTLEHVQLLLDANADIMAKTKLGQMPVHIAVATGRLDLVTFILSSTKDIVNTPDIDGWTPLLWACRIGNKWGTPRLEAPMIQLLLSYGADLWVKGHGHDCEWSPLKLARFHGADKEIIHLLTPKHKTRVNKDGLEESWDPASHTSRRAYRTPGYCHGCLFAIYGTMYVCLNCANEDLVTLCFKCWEHKDKIHSHDNNWEVQGKEYEDDESEDEQTGEEDNDRKPESSVE